MKDFYKEKQTFLTCGTSLPTCHYAITPHECYKWHHLSFDVVNMLMKEMTDLDLGQVEGTYMP